MTGGAKGIGEATVRLFTRHGAKVVVADVDDTLGNILATSLAPSTTFIHCDVCSEADIENLIASTVSLYGRLDILFNNAGVLGNQSKNKSILNFDTDEFDRVMQVKIKRNNFGWSSYIGLNRGCKLSDVTLNSHNSELVSVKSS